MKILMLTPEEFFFSAGTPLSVLHRTKTLGDLGYEIDMLTYHLGETPKIKNTKIYRIRAPFFIKKIPIGPSFTKILLDAILFLKALSLIRKNRYDYLHAHEEAVYLAVIFKKIFKIPLIYDMHSSIAEQLAHNKNILYSNGILVGLVGYLEKLALKTADRVIVICPHLLDLANKTYPSQKYVLIENCLSDVDFSRVTEDNRIEVREKLSIPPDYKVVVYIGTLEHYQGIDLLINSLPFVLKTNPQVKYVIVGGLTEQIKVFKNLAESLGVAESVIFISQRETEEMPDYLALADVLVSPRAKGTNTPLKIYDYLKSGKPVVATNLLTHTQVLNQNTAVLTEPNPEKFAEGVISILKNSGLSAKISEEARKIADSKYSEREYIIKIKKIYESKI